MMKARNILLSIGAAIASTKLAHMISDIELEDVLGTVGLSRRRTHVPENLAFLGAGILVGGAAALLLAPMSGEETRQRLAQKADDLRGEAERKVREIREEMNGLRPRIGNSSEVTSGSNA